MGSTLGATGVFSEGFMVGKEMADKTGDVALGGAEGGGDTGPLTSRLPGAKPTSQEARRPARRGPLDRRQRIWAPRGCASLPESYLAHVPNTS